MPNEEEMWFQFSPSAELFGTPWTAVHQTSLSIINSQSPPKPMSIELVMPSNHLSLCHPLLLPPSIFLNTRVFSNGQLFASDGHSIGVSASTSVLPMNTQDCFPLGWTGWISLQSRQHIKKQRHHFANKGLSSQGYSFPSGHVWM